MIETKFNFDVNYQKKILGMMTRDPKFLFSYGLDLIKPNYFTHFYFQIICKNLVFFVNEWNYLPDKDSFARFVTKNLKQTDTAQDIIESILSLMDEIFYMDVEKIEDVVDYVLRFIQEQSLKQGLSKVVSILERGGDLEDAISIIQNSISIGKPLSYGLYFNNNVGTLQSRYSEEYAIENSISTGYPKLDRKMLGGMFRKFLYIVVAPPGRGKTTFLSNVSAHNIMVKKNVVFYTLEVPEVEIEFKHVSNVANLSHDDVLKLPNKVLQEKLEVFKDCGSLFIKYFDPHTITVSAIKSHLYRLKYNYGFEPDLIIIDYADNMNSLGTDNQKNQNSYEERGSLYSDLISLAVSYNCPVLSASQPKVDAWTKDTITKGDLAESSKKAHLAHGIISLNQTPEEKTLNQMRAYTAKMRKGLENESVYLSTRLEYSKIIEKIQEEDD